MKLIAKTASAEHRWIDTEDGGAVVSQADIGEMLEANKAAYIHNDGYTKSREMRRVASIPNIIRLKWQLEEGWDCFDPANAHRLMLKLNDPDWLYLRTAPGKLGWNGDSFR